MSRLEKRLMSAMGRAVGDFQLIQKSDRILVAVSGGKDSLSLLHLLSRLKERAPVEFSLVAVHLDAGHEGVYADRLEKHFQKHQLEYRIIKEDIFSIVRKLAQPEKSHCSICSRLRRGILYNAAVDLQCNKLALGHHREDLIETLLLSAFFSGSLKSMPAKFVSDDGRNQVIRPLVYCLEENLREYSLQSNLPVLSKDVCCEKENPQRRKMKNLIAQLAQENPAVPGNLLHALKHVVPSHLLDSSVVRREFPFPLGEGEET